jgi:hypothetical protein
LAALSEAAHHKTSLFLKENPPQQPLTAMLLGRLRLEIKKNLSVELKEIDAIVQELIK